MKKTTSVRPPFCFFLILLLSSLTASAVTTSGSITGEETWSGTVHLWGDVTITESGNLSIQPGTRIECEPLIDDQVSGLHTNRIEISIENKGILNAIGTKENPILFTSSGNNPKSGDWYGIVIGSNNVKLKYCNISYSTYGISFSSDSSLIPQNLNIVIEYCNISYNLNEGVWVHAAHNSNNMESIIINNCNIFQNDKNGIYVNRGQMEDAICTVTISGCTIYNNKSNGILVDTEFRTYTFTNELAIQLSIMNNIITNNNESGIYNFIPYPEKPQTYNLKDNIIKNNKNGLVFQILFSPKIEIIGGGNDIFDNKEFDIRNH